MTLEIKPFHEPESGTWTYLVADTSSAAAIIIDPVWVYDPVSGMADSAFFDGILEEVDRCGFNVGWVLETHAHADHLTAAGEIKRRIGAQIACGKGICSVQETFSLAFNLNDVACDGRQFDRLLAEGDTLPLGEHVVRVIDTPGHTNDSVTYLVGEAAFIGDTLFAPSFGSARCDFPGGDAGQLFDSISRLYELPEETRLYLCHDYPKAGESPVCHITVAESRQSNIHVTAGTQRRDYVRMRQERDAKLSLPRLILPALQVNIRAGEAPAAESNGAAYLKMPFNQHLADLISDSTEEP